MVEYSVDSNSDIGKRIANSKVAVVVTHDERTRQNNSLKDIYVPKMVDYWCYRPKKKKKKKKKKKNTPATWILPMLIPAEAEVRKNAGAIDMFLNKGKLQELKLTDLPNVLYTYVNSKVDTGLDNLGKDFGQWLERSPCECSKRPP